MKSPARLFQSLAKFIALCACLASASAQHESAPPEIVSAWKLNGENSLAVFTHDGRFYTILNNATVTGFERGTFTWNKVTHSFAATTTVDTNSDSGFSHPDGATSIIISGNTLNYTVEGEGTFTFTRVVNTASAIVGSWYVPNARISATFLADGTYYLAEEPFASEDGPLGMEFGTFSWNAATKAFSATRTSPSVLTYGLDYSPSGSTIDITGNAMVFNDTEEETLLRRITPISVPLITKNDFEVDKFTNYRQTSNADPVLLPGSSTNTTDDFPFWGEAYIESSVGGAGGTLSITAKPIISFGADEDGEWGIETQYTSLNALNTAFPNGSSYVFARNGGSSTLIYPAGGTFPVTPKVLLGDFASGRGNWNNGRYFLGFDQILTWSNHITYDPNSLVTVLTVVEQSTGKEYLKEDVIQGDIGSYDFTGKLPTGRVYDVQIEHVRIANSTTTGTGPFAGKLGYALYNANTRFEMVVLPPSVPQILKQPVSQTGVLGSPLILSIEIADAILPSVTYKWYRNDIVIEGQTGNSIFFPSFDPNANSGSYRATVTNSSGTAVSNSVDVGNITRGVERLIVSKRKISQQQTSSTLADFGAGFDARVEGFGISSTFPASSISLRKPDTSAVALALDGDHWDAETDFASLAALQTSFPNGIYSINIGADSVPINMGSTSYPNQPLVTASKGTWVGGKLRVTASEAAAGFTLTTNSTTGNGFISVSVVDSNDDDLVDVTEHETPIEPAFAVAPVAAGLLTVGQSYEVEAEFDNVINTSQIGDKSWATDDGNAFGLLSATTVFNIEVVADPTSSAYSTWQSGFFNSMLTVSPLEGGDAIT